MLEPTFLEGRSLYWSKVHGELYSLMNDVLKRAELIKDESTLCVHREKN